MNTNTRTPGNIISDQRGSITLEFSVVIIVVVSLYIFLITIAFFISDKSAVVKVSRDGGREYALSGSLYEAEQKARDTAWLYGLDLNRLNVQFDKYNSGSRTLLSCEVEYLSQPFFNTFPTIKEVKDIGAKKLKEKSIFGRDD